MAKKAVVLLIALVLVLSVALAVWAQAEPPPVGMSIGTLTADPINVAQTPSLTLEWTKAPPTAAYVETPFTVSVKATNSGAEIPRVLYIVEIKKNGSSATPDDVTIIGRTVGEQNSYPLGYDDTTNSSRPFFYWGPRQGFTFPEKTTREAEFTVTFNRAGTYSFTIWAVKLQ